MSRPQTQTSTPASPASTLTRSAQFYDRLIAEGVPAWCLTRKDGQFSAYVDAVTGRVYPSSYEDHPGVAFSDAATFTAAYQGFGA